MVDERFRDGHGDPEAMATLFRAVPPVRLRCLANNHVFVYAHERGRPTPPVLAKLICPVCRTAGAALTAT